MHNPARRADENTVELRPYQQEVLSPLRERFVYGDPPGTGKTPTTLRWLSELGAERTLIVAPLPVLHHWEGQADVWYPDLPVVLGNGKPEQRHLARRCLDFGGALVINYETLRGDQDELVKMKWDAVVFDEAHRLKNRKALVHKAAVKFARRAGGLVLATGTPILNRAEEAWSLFHLLHPKEFASFWRWAHAHYHVYTAWYGGRAVQELGDLKPGADLAIRNQLGLSLVKRPLDMLLDLPPVIQTTLEIDLSPAERKAFDAMEKHSWAKIDDSVQWASNELAKRTRLRQLASDWSTWDDERIELGAKAKATIELVDDLEPEQVVIFVAYKATARKLVAELGKRAVAFTGDENDLERDTALRKFKNCDAQVIVGTIGAMGEGVDGLQVARHMVILDRDHTPGIEDQMIGRIRRSGQRAASITVTFIEARDTTDQWIKDLSSSKRERIEVIVPDTV